MKTDRERADEAGCAFALAVFLGVIVMLMCQSCLAPALLGVKSVKTAGGTEVNFITGADFRIGANGIDKVEEKRGIEPQLGYYERTQQR